MIESSSSKRLSSAPEGDQWWEFVGFVCQPVDSRSAGLTKLIAATSGHAADVVLVFHQFHSFRRQPTSMDLAELMALDYVCQNVKQVSNVELYVCRHLPSKQVTSSG
jgi:hypothetical protein